MSMTMMEHRLQEFLTPIIERLDKCYASYLSNHKGYYQVLWHGKPLEIKTRMSWRGIGTAKTRWYYYLKNMLWLMKYRVTAPLPIAQFANLDISKPNLHQITNILVKMGLLEFKELG